MEEQITRFQYLVNQLQDHSLATF